MSLVPFRKGFRPGAGPKRKPNPVLAAQGLPQAWNALDFMELSPEVLLSYANMTLTVVAALDAAGEDRELVRPVIKGLLSKQPADPEVWRQLEALGEPRA